MLLDDGGAYTRVLIQDQEDDEVLMENEVMYIHVLFLGRELPNVHAAVLHNRA